MKRRYILIDTENVQNHWFKLLEDIRKKDKILVFYTQNHSKRLDRCIENNPDNKRIRWIECVSGINALDYQLMGVLAYLINQHPKAEFIIYSNDRDYQERVAYWIERGANVERRGFSLKQKKKKPTKTKEQGTTYKTTMQKTKAQSSMTPEVMAQSAEPAGAGASLTIKEYIKAVCKSIPATGYSALYATFTADLGQEMGRECYMRFKTDPEYREKMGKHYMLDNHSRAINLVETILLYHGLDVKQSEAVLKIVNESNKNNKQAIKRRFDSYFGTHTEVQQGYYQAMKGHVPVIKDILTAK